MSDAPRRLPPKKEVALALLEGPSAYVHLDPRRAGVVVPKWLMGQPQLVLQVGLNMAIPIPDLKVDDEGVSCTLSFNRQAFWCVLPWSAVYALVGEDGRGMIWPNDVPPEVSLQMQKAAPPPKAPAKKARTKLSVADGDGRKTRSQVGATAGEDGERADGDPIGRGARKEPASDGAPDGGSAPPGTPAAPGRGRRAPTPAAARAGDDGSDGADANARPMPAIAPSPAAAPGSPRRPKRELPPYLRVIK